MVLDFLLLFLKLIYTNIDQTDLVYVLKIE